MKHRKPNPPGHITPRNIALGASVALGAGAAVTGFTGTAQAATVSQWDRIAACESGDANIPGSGNWNLPYGDADSTGGLQIQTRTWDAFGGQQYAPTAGQATKQQQIMVAEKILGSSAQGGSAAWVCNQPGHGIASGALGFGTGQSMYNGGPNPYPAGGGGVVTPPPVPVPVPVVTHHWRHHWNNDVHVRRYTVKAGDYLIKIAREQNVQGGWHSLYMRNKAIIGPNPNRIEIGQVLCLDVQPGAAPGTGGGGTPPPPPAPPGNSQGYVAPLSHYTLGDGLIVGAGGSMSRSQGGHSGQDMIAPSGEVVKSVAAGVVTNINQSGAAYGNLVVVRHEDGKYTLYAHLSAITVSIGQSVAEGQQVGNVGSTGNSSGPHLHFEVRTDPTAFTSGIFLSPVVYMAAHGVTL